MDKLSYCRHRFPGWFLASIAMWRGDWMKDAEAESVGSCSRVREINLLTE
jgi:hypothetical protein